MNAPNEATRRAVAAMDAQKLATPVDLPRAAYTTDVLEKAASRAHHALNALAPTLAMWEHDAFVARVLGVPRERLHYDGDGNPRMLDVEKL